MQATQSIQNSSFLLRQFREFYQEVIRQKRLASAGILKFQTMSTTGEVPTTDTMVHAIWQSLIFNLEQQAAASARSGSDYSSTIYKETMYVMCALADEIFLTLHWEGKDKWKDTLLESYLFQSHISGDQFFTKLDELMQSRDAASVELASVFFMALSLGFQGRYRGSADTSALEKYKQQLFTYIFRRDPELLSEAKQIFPSSYEYTVTKGTGKRLTSPKRWFIASAVTIVVFYAVSHYLWMDITSDFHPVISSILGIR